MAIALPTRYYISVVIASAGAVAAGARWTISGAGNPGAGSNYGPHASGAAVEATAYSGVAWTFGFMSN